MIITLNDSLKEGYYKPVAKNRLVEQFANIKQEYIKVNGKVDYNKKKKTQDLFYVSDNIDGEYAQKNYLEYLAAAWDAHLGIIIKPDIIWYTLMCELTSIVATHTEVYRGLFTTSQEKKEITVFSKSLTEMPLDTLMEALKEEVPSEISAFMPEFSTSTQRSIFAVYAAFADMVSPYYNYSMYCCGFPAIDVQGDASDWNKLLKSWKEIGKLFKNHQTYAAKIEDRLAQISGNLNDADFWRNMFILDKCGSGHQYTVRGWFNDFYEHLPDLAFVENYPSHTSVVKYKQLNTGRNYEMKQGLLSSKSQGAWLVPDFAQVIYEKTAPVQTSC